jgi:hypothetical protein
MRGKMAYPFVQMPTWGEFIKALISKDCRQGEAGDLIGPRGATIVRYLEAPSGVTTAILPNVKPSTRVTTTTYLSFQRALGVKTGLVPELDIYD